VYEILLTAAGFAEEFYRCGFRRAWMTAKSVPCARMGIQRICSTERW